DMDFGNLSSFLSIFPLRKETEGLYTYILARIRREPTKFSRQEVRKFLKRMIRGSSTWNRLAAYKLGIILFGKRFASPADQDSSRIIRQWARSLAEGPQEELF
ncbi:unnamed protein product, partial [marine sediment metagenome]